MGDNYKNMKNMYGMALAVLNFHTELSFLSKPRLTFVSLLPRQRYIRDSLGRQRITDEQACLRVPGRLLLIPDASCLGTEAISSKGPIICGLGRELGIFSVEFTEAHSRLLSIPSAMGDFCERIRIFARSLTTSASDLPST